MLYPTWIETEWTPINMFMYTITLMNDAKGKHTRYEILSNIANDWWFQLQLWEVGLILIAATTSKYEQQKRNTDAFELFKRCTKDIPSGNLI